MCEDILEFSIKMTLDQVCGYFRIMYEDILGPFLRIFYAKIEYLYQMAVNQIITNTD